MVHQQNTAGEINNKTEDMTEALGSFKNFTYQVHKNTNEKNV